jgi:hypothetical protein
MLADLCYGPNLEDWIMRITITINIGEKLLAYAKLQAAQPSCTLKQVIEGAFHKPRNSGDIELIDDYSTVAFPCPTNSCCRG